MKAVAATCAMVAGVQAFTGPAVHSSFSGAGLATRAAAASPLQMVTTTPGDASSAHAETNGKPWDPFGFSIAHTQNTHGFLPHAKWLAEAEVKNGRVAMLAVVGILVTHAGIHIPGLGYETSDWLAAPGEFASKNPLGLAQVITAIAVVEGQTYPGDFWQGGGDRNIGEFGFDPLNFSRGKSDAVKNSYKQKEVKNGRLAMIAFAAFASEHLFPGSVPALSAIGGF